MDEDNKFIKQLLTGLVLFAVLCLLGYWLGSGSSSPNPDYSDDYCDPKTGCW